MILSFANIFEYNGKFNCSCKLLFPYLYCSCKLLFPFLFPYSSSCLLQLQPVVLVLASVTIFIFSSVLSSCVWSNDCSSVYQNKLHYYQPLAFRCHTHIYIYTHTYIYIYYIISYIYINFRTMKNEF